VRAAINCFNTIGGENRLDDAIITSHHAIEMLLKASLLQKSARIIDTDSGYYAQFKPCLNFATYNQKTRFLSEDDRQVLLLIDAARGDAYHGLLEFDETEAYALVSSTIEIFQKVLWEVFWKDLATLLGSMVLPISTIPLSSSVMLLDRKGEQIRHLLSAGDSYRAQAAARSLAILEKASQGDDDARVTEADVQDTVNRIADSDTITDAFPGIAGLPITQTANGATIFISVKRRQGQVEAAEHPDGHDAPVVAVEQRDYKDTHPFRFTDLKHHVGVSQHRLRGVIAELGLTEEPAYYHEHGPAKGKKTGGYSQKAVEKIKKFVESYDGDLLELYRKHYRR
jgi:hypothetical protein